MQQRCVLVIYDGDYDKWKWARDSQLSWSVTMRLSCFEATAGPVLPGLQFSGKARKLGFIKN